MTQDERKKAFEHVFVNQAWGNRANAGVNYKRPYNKTKRKRGE